MARRESSISASISTTFHTGFAGRNRLVFAILCPVVDKSQRDARNLRLKGMCFPIFNRLVLSALFLLLDALL